VSKGKRDRIFKDFRNNKDPHIMIAHPKCMSHGLDLCAASLIIWYAPHNKSTYNQACARIDGSRQDVKIDVAHIYATDEERRAYKVIQEQGKMQDVLLNMMRR
jgi:SNF2 family DNA or RNA helicase